MTSPRTRRLEDKSVDFLAQRRKKRETDASNGRYLRLPTKLDIDNLSNLPKTDRIRQTLDSTAKLEKECDMKKRFLQHSPVMSMEKIDAEGQVDDALLNSIKAKLKILD